jgi:serine-type D-Ala-D-Ala carboxypeptidase (penicillin-binding protein 5/6)
MKKFRFITCFLIIVALAGILTVSAFAADPQIDTTQAAMLIAVDDDGTEMVLYEKDADEQLYPASLTKIMTVLLAVEDIEAGKISLTDSVTAQSGFDYDLVSAGSSVYIVQGETMSLENLLYCAMLSSGNDACNVIAQYIGGTISDFIARMNARAEELGCTGTNFANTHGLPNENHYTTARDFSRIVCAAASHELFMTICNTVTYTVPATNLSIERTLSNSNSLINPSNSLYPGDWSYEYAKGIKTGHTTAAGYCLASSAEKDGMRLISVVLKCDSYTQADGTVYYGHFADTRTLFEWGFENYRQQYTQAKITGIIATVTDASKTIASAFGEALKLIS